MSDKKDHWNQARCRHCGYAGARHHRRKVYPDDGPPGSYHYRMECPSGRKTYTQEEVTSGD